MILGKRRGPIDQLRDRNEGVRLRAAQTLAEVGNAEAIEPLVEAMTRERGAVAAAAAVALDILDDSGFAVPPRLLLDALERIEWTHKSAYGAYRVPLASLWVRQRRQSAGQRRDLRALDVSKVVLATCLLILRDRAEPGPQPELRRLLNHEKPDVRVRVAETLGYVGDSSVVEPLVAAVLHDLRQVAAAAVIGLDVLDGRGYRVETRFALQILTRANGPVPPGLFGTNADERPRSSESCRERDLTVEQRDDRLEPDLMRLLRGKASLLLRGGTAADLPALKGLWRSQLNIAAEVLPSIDDPAVPQWLGEQARSGVSVAVAIRALGKCVNPGAAGVLVELFCDPPSEAFGSPEAGQDEIAKVLGTATHRPTSETLLALFGTPPANLRSPGNARAALAKLLTPYRDPRAVELFIDWLGTTTRTEHRRAALDALTGVASDGRVVDEMLARLARGETDVIRVLGSSRDPRAIPALTACLTAADTWVQAVKALAELGDRQSVPTLCAELDKASGDRIECLATALAKLGDKRALPALRRHDKPDIEKQLDHARFLDDGYLAQELMPYRAVRRAVVTLERP
jgi:HEAT repeat protein